MGVLLLVVSCEWEGYVDPGNTGSRLTVLEVPERYQTIQEAIDAALDGDTIMVASGTYTGDGNYDIRFNKKAIIVRSAKGPDSTIIFCGGTSADPKRAFIFTGKEDTNSVVEGFTIDHGYATDESINDGWGGAVYIQYSSPRFTNCVFTGCKSKYGGAVACRTAAPIFENCTFIGNTAFVEGGAIKSEGAANPKIRNCSFENNSASERGGCIDFRNASASVIGSKFISNSAGDPGYGGAILCYSSSPYFEDCIFYLNSGIDGGGIYCAEKASPKFQNCTLVQNRSNNIDGASGFSCNSGSLPYIDYCIIANGVLGQAVVVNDPNNIPTLTGCSIFGNEGGDWVGLIAGQETLRNNRADDPLFCDEPVTEDARLDADSPCWPDNNPSGNQIGAFVSNCDSQ
jgi:predicted outer membrane repeat protein